MRRLALKTLLLAAALVALAAPALPQDEKGPDDRKGSAAAERLANVVVLGKRQLLADAAAFDAFCEENSGRARSELRSEVMGRLKEIAAAERPALLEALGSPEQYETLWLLNAVVVRVPVADVEKIRELDAVKWAYGAGMIPEWNPQATGAAPREVSTVLPTVGEREPFVAKGKTIPWNLKALNVPRVWKDLGVTGEGALVVSIDNGLNYNQQDLTANIWRNDGETPNDGKDDDGNGLVDDVYGFDFGRISPEILDVGKRQHGTLTSSLVVGDGTGGTVTGVAPRAKLMPLRAAGGPVLAARAMQYALDQGGDVVSMSFSIPLKGDIRGLWRMLAENATCAGLVLVSGAGNFQKTEEVPVQIRIPEGIPCVICVGGVTEKLKLSPISSMGPVEWGGVKFYEDHALPKGLIKPDVSAFPGPAIGLVGTQGNDTYLQKNNGRRGNSLSAPQVAGTIALMLSANPELTPWRVKAILEETAKDLKPRGKDVETGAGLVNAYEAVKQAIKERKPETATTPR